MKRLTIALSAMLLSVASFAQVEITKVDKVKPTDEIFMEMAVTAAQKSVADGHKPEGAVVILNGAWRSTGLPVDGKTPEVNAIEKSRSTSLSGASIYTINQPTTAAMNAMKAANVDAVYFVNPAADVIAAGIYTEDDYNADNLNSDGPIVESYQIVYAPASKLIKK